MIGIVPGSTRPDELVLYTAHWDHLGTDPDLAGDGIYNGAVDNASGLAGLLVLADAFTSLAPRPERSVAFLFVTAEEQGLLGSRYYATHPIYPLRKTVAVINVDGLNVHGPTRDMVLVGGESSDLADDLRTAAALQGRVVTDEPEPEKGYFFRSDQFSFAREGVPVLYAESGWDSVEHGAAWGKARSNAYTAERYHKPSDEIDPSWDLRGALLDLGVWFEIGRSLAMSTRFPEWAPDSEFRAAREP